MPQLPVEPTPGLPQFRPLPYVAAGVSFAATRVALNYENLAWAAIFAVLTVLAFVVTFRDQGTRGVFAVYDHEEDAVYKSASGTIIALVTAMFFDATGDAFTPHFVIPPAVADYGLFGLWSVTLSLGMIADARRLYRRRLNRMKRVLKQPIKALPPATSAVEQRAMYVLRDGGATGGWRMKIKTLAKKLGISKDEAVELCERMRDKGTIAIYSIGYKNKPHEWNVELTASGLAAAIRGSGTRS